MEHKNYYGKIYLRSLLLFYLVGLIAINSNATNRRLTIKNTTGFPANDLHLKLHSSGYPPIDSVKCSKFNGAVIPIPKYWNNPGPGEERTDSITFTTNSNNQAIAQNEKITIDFFDVSVFQRIQKSPDSSFFTNNGIKINGGIKFILFDNIWIKPHATTGSISFQNLESESISFSDLEVFTDNPTDPFLSDPWSPTGNAVLSIPSSFNLGVGATQSYNFPIINNGNFVSVRCSVALASDPGDLYLYEFSALQVNEIPTLSQWGLIIFGLMLISLCIVYIRKKRLALAGFDAEYSATINKFEWKNFFRLLSVVLLFAILFLAAGKIFTGVIKSEDIVGSLVCSIVVAVIIQLLYIRGRKDTIHNKVGRHDKRRQ